MKFTTILTVSMICTLAACSSSSPPPPPATTAAPSVQQPTVFDAQLKALDKAKAVQATMDKQRADADKKLQDQGG